MRSPPTGSQSNALPMVSLPTIKSTDSDLWTDRNSSVHYSSVTSIVGGSSVAGATHAD